MFDICLIVSSGAHWDNQWSFVLSHWLPDKIYLLGDVDEKLRPFRDKGVAIQSLEDLPDKDLVLMQPENARYIQGDISLHDFKHPEDCIYIFGSDNFPLSEDQTGNRYFKYKVYIPTSTKDDMYSYMAGAITLYDRDIK